MEFRFVICVDIDAENLPSAYRKLRERMSEEGQIAAQDWESTDEAYDDDGAPIPEEQLSAARLGVLAQEQDD